MGLRLDCGIQGEDRFFAEGLTGRGGGIRTPDPLLPKQMRYQAALRPDHTDFILMCR
jgi:hypothetical protein